MSGLLRPEKLDSPSGLGKIAAGGFPDATSVQIIHGIWSAATSRTAQIPCRSRTWKGIRMTSASFVRLRSSGTTYAGCAEFKELGGRACKPDSVPHANRKTVCARGDHSSSPGIATGIQQPTRGFYRAGPALPSYLALHHAGFSVPPVSPPGRWALTPPFHPCQAPPSRAMPGGIFSVALSVIRTALGKRSGQIPSR